jgi:hypothetical protein
MGATSSKVYVTDWEKADGHLHHDETLDRSSPFANHRTLLLRPSHKAHSSAQRDFQVVNEAGDTLYYTTRGVPNTAFWFDILKNEEPMLQVRGHPWGTEWDIYAYHAPSFVGQEPVSPGAPLYLKARVLLNWTKDSAKVQLCHKKNAKLEWSDPVLIYDDTNFLMGKGQTHLPADTNLVSYCESMTADTERDQPGAHPIKLELAKGCDVALHIILTVIANVVHSNANPFLAHSSNSYSHDLMM